MFIFSGVQKLQPFYTETPTSINQNKKFMKKTLLLIFSAISCTCFAQNNFISTIGTGGYDELYAVIQTPDGGFIGAGYTDDNSNNDYTYVVKVNANGQQVWNKIVQGTTGFSEGYGIINTSDGGFVISGSMNDKMAILKFDANGNLSWSKQYNELISSDASKLLQTADGGYLLSGGISADGGNQYQSYLIKTDASGNVQWSKKYFNTYYSVILDIKKTNDGNYVFIAVNYSEDADSDDTTYIVKTNTSGGVLWSKYFTEAGFYADGRSLLPTSDGGYVIAGYTYGNEDDGFMVKVDGSGNFKWSKYTNEGSSFYSVIEVSDGSYVAIGYGYNGETNDLIYLTKVSSAGALVWTRTISFDNLAANVYHLLKTGNGYIGVGSLYDYEEGNSSALFMKFDANFNSCKPAAAATGWEDFGVFGNATVPTFTGTTSVSNASVTTSTNGTFTNICTALPLTLLDFNAEAKVQSVALKWKTGEEKNTDYFDVETSIDAKIFTAVAQVKAAGNSTSIKSYTAVDKNPVAGDNWYRLKMVDKDGQYAYSNILKISFTGKSIMLVYPNPAVNNAIVVFNAEKAGSYSIQVTDLSGKLLQTIKGAATEGENKVNLSVGNYARGTYLVNIRTETSTSALKLNKQ